MCLSLKINAQIKPKFGIRAGMHVSSLFGDKELDDNGLELETFKSVVKVNVGATMQLPLTKQIGLYTEALFIQKGINYNFSSDDSYLQIPTLGHVFEGHRRSVDINITNGYIEVPLLFYVELIDDKFQLDFGPSIGFLISSRGLGSLKYIDESFLDDFIEFNLDYRYMKDSLGQIVETTAANGIGKVDGTTVVHPFAIGAYYLSDTKTSNFFRTLDWGLNMGIAYYFTSGLRLGARAYYGFQDITNEEHRVSQLALDDNLNLIRLETDRATNFNVQLFIGLQF